MAITTTSLPMQSVIASILMDTEKVTPTGDREFKLVFVDKSAIEAGFDAGSHRYFVKYDIPWYDTYMGFEDSFAAMAHTVLMTMCDIETEGVKTIDPINMKARDLKHAYHIYCDAMKQKGRAPLSANMFAETTYLDTWCEADPATRAGLFA